MTLTERWSLANAAALLVAGGLAAWIQSVVPLLAVGIGMLGALVLVGGSEWTPTGRFGTANTITAFRIGGLALLPVAASLGSAYLIGLSLLLLALDGVDGWFARRYALSSEFGSFFDKETDSLFLLLLCGLSAFRGPLSVWILGAGLLRYGFVLTVFFLPSPETTESRSTWARYVYGFMIGALLATFLPVPAVWGPLVVLATAALLVSFGVSLWRIVARVEDVGRS